MDSFNVLVLGPGGNKGYAELGILQYLESSGRIKNLHDIVGVSVGSIISLLLVCGYSVMDILGQSHEANLLDGTNLFGSMREMLIKQGLFDQRTLEEKLESMVKKKVGFIPSLSELYAFSGKNYVSVTTNVSKPVPESVYLSKDTEPNLSCIKAALMSSNIPIIFAKCTYMGNHYVDGALSDPYPVLKFDLPGARILGIYITSVPISVSDDLNDYIMHSFTSPVLQLKERSKKLSSDRCVHMDMTLRSRVLSSIIMTDDEKGSIFIEGHRFAKRFFERKEVSRVDDLGDVETLETAEPVYD